MIVSAVVGDSLLDIRLSILLRAQHRGQDKKLNFTDSLKMIYPTQ
jgi:hypothetical protein